ncbi:hypothetical protein [Halomonas tibetensis]|uniref:DNA polymerase II n=1 Tax=Halomonas tibetensis TaxID=2259590 RepID=A0ABV7B8M1_9GAMM
MSTHHGFILTRHWEESLRGTEVTLWLATDQGPLRVRLPVQPAVSFLPAELRAQAEALLADDNEVGRGVTMRGHEIMRRTRELIEADGPSSMMISQPSSTASLGCSEREGASVG